jgi:lipopolysaccharide/colanic/teichoic acid biosynthesis glycosyltransferase
MVAVRIEDTTEGAVELRPRLTELPATPATLADAAAIDELPADFIPIIPLDFHPASRLQLGLKRVLDLVGAAIGLVVLSPILLVAVLAILATDGRPVLFRQARVGRGGRSFTIVKFRTMIRDAEERYAELAQHSDTRGAAFKMTNDPRITRLGRILRKTSVDELPQLWNVLRGEMSLVGPRPAPAREVVLYEPWHLQRLKMKPGLTGAWQISARMDDDFDRRAAIDVDYVTSWSVLLDVKIILATIPALIRQPGR